MINNSNYYKTHTYLENVSRHTKYTYMIVNIS